jgi:hypothetical protein
MPTMIEVKQSNDNWYLYHDGDILRTPDGVAIGSHSREVVLKAQADCEAHGLDPANFPSVYGLLCSYLQFGGEEEREELTGAILSDLEDDLVYREFAFISSMSPEQNLVDLVEAPWPVDYLKHMGFFRAWRVCSSESNIRAIDLGKIQAVFDPVLRTLSLRKLMTLVYVSANWNSAIGFLAMLDGDYAPESFARLLDEADADRHPALRNKELFEDLLFFARLPEDREIVINGG